MKVATAYLAPGTTVLTTEPDGDDFGIPLVSVGKPSTRRAPATRTVRQRARTGAGIVVWFTDGTKTRPLHGRTAWTVWHATENPSCTMVTTDTEGTTP